jgi:hypothetical protein
MPATQRHIPEDQNNLSKDHALQLFRPPLRPSFDLWLSVTRMLVGFSWNYLQKMSGKHKFRENQLSDSRRVPYFNWGVNKLPAILSIFI